MNMTQIGDKELSRKRDEESEERSIHSNGRIMMELNEMITADIKAGQNLADEFIMRAPTLDDVEAAFELYEACSKHMIGKSETTLSHIRSEWTSPGFSLDDSVRIVETPSGDMVGYIEIWDLDTPPVNIWAWGRVHPEFEGQGIGTKLMEWAEVRARQSIIRVPEDARVVMRSGTHSHYDPARDLLVDRGMNLVRHFLTMAIDMDAEPEPARWPSDIQVRPMNDQEELIDIVHAVRDAFQDHWGYFETPFDEEYKQWLHFTENDDKFDPKLWFLAMDGDEIAGVSLCRLESDEDPNMSWVSVLGVRRPWRRKGLGLALLKHSFTEFWQRGKKQAGLGVDAGSLTGATGLYEKAGMSSIRQFDLYEKELRPGRDLTKQTV
jgi:GNAT superfamily N-acetyltransferase